MTMTIKKISSSKLDKRIKFIQSQFAKLDVKTSIKILRREGKAIDSYLDKDGEWNGTYYDSFEYNFWNFCALDDLSIDLYKNNCVLVQMEYDNEDTIDFLVYFKKDKTVEIVGFDYYLGADFYYKITEKFKKNFKVILGGFMEEYHNENNYLKNRNRKTQI